MYFNTTTENCSSSFHVILTLYFDVDMDLPRVKDLRSILCELTGIAHASGCKAAEGSFWQSNDTPCRPQRLKAGQLTDFLNHFSDEMQASGSVSVIHKESNKRFDSDIEITCMPSTPYGRSKIPSTLQVLVSERIIEEIGAEAINKILLNCMKIIDSCRPFYGFIDIALHTDALKGANYGPIPNLSTSIQQKCQMNDWLHYGSKSRDRARGIYWGNYFGSNILQKLGGKVAFVNRYSKQIGGYQSKTAAVYAFEEGIFLSLSKSFLNAVPSPAIELVDLNLHRNLLWLQAELAAAQVYGVWDQESAQAAQLTVSGEG